MQTHLVKNATVLVVDDNALILQLVSSWLNNKGYHVSFATNGKQAISIAQTVPFDLILLDVQMPDIDGYEVCRQLKKIAGTKNIPIIFLTAKSETEDMAKGYDAGGVDFITKPFNPVEMLARVKTHVELKRALDYMKAQKEAEIKQSEERFTQIVEQTNEMIWEINADCLFTYVSPGCELIYGYQPEELIGKMHFYDLHPEEGRESFRQALATVFSFNKPFRELINAGMTKSGNLVWVSTNGLPITDADGNLLGYRGAEYNITDRKLAEEALRENELKYRSLIENAFDAIYLLKNGQYEYVNHHFCEMTGYTKEELLSQSFSPESLFIDYEQNATGLLKSQPIAEAHDGLFNAQLLQKNGNLIDVNLSMVTLNINNRRSVLGIIREVTQQKKMIRELKDAKEKAEEMNRVKSHFLALLSHELRTPLNGILGFAQMLNMELNDPDHHHMTDVILKSGIRLKSTLTNLLDLTKIEANQSDFHLSEISIGEILQSEVVAFSSAARDKRISLNIDIAADDLIVHCEDGIIKSIIGNLLDNAIKYTNHGGVTVKVSQGCLSDNRAVVIEVIDTGIGVPESMKGIIFEEFRQASEGISRGFEGVGLGLTLAKRYTELLNGRIELNENEGGGSIFRVILPLVPGDKANGAKETASSQNAAEQAPSFVPQRECCRILNVDDDPVSQSLVETLLEKFCQVDTANNAKGALDKVASTQYDVILMDINLGKGMNGLAAVKEIRKLENYKTVPIIALTAFAMEGDREEFLSNGCSHYLSKPYENRELVKLVNEILLTQEANG